MSEDRRARGMWEEGSVESVGKEKRGPNLRNTVTMELRWNDGKKGGKDDGNRRSGKG